VHFIYYKSFIYAFRTEIHHIDSKIILNLNLNLDTRLNLFLYRFIDYIQVERYSYERFRDMLIHAMNVMHIMFINNRTGGNNV